MTSDGTLSCSWVMPFSNSTEVIVRNLGNQEVRIDDFTIETSAYKWTDKSMHFGAGWFEQNRLKTVNDGVNKLGEDHGHFDVNYVTLTGKGVLVGSSVTLFNTIDSWWGEGDEKIFVDNEPFPSHFGTGTEDYYGYAWSNPNMFEHPYIAQPDGSGAIATGHVVNLRYRGLDAIPFHEKIQVDVEMWHWLKTTINHAPVSYWYMLPGGKSNINPEPEAAKKPVSLSRMDFFLEGYYDRNIFMRNTKVEIKGQEKGYEIRYTLDGSTPTKKSILYTKPFKLNKSVIAKAIGYLPNGYTTEILEGEFIRQSPIKGVKLKSPKSGLSYDYLESTEVIEFIRQIRDFKTTSSGVVPTFEFPQIKLSGIFGMVVTGYVKVPKKGIYTFSTNTNDGSILYIHDQLVVNNDGGHGARERVGQVALKPGYHPIKLEYFQMGGGKQIEVYMDGPGIEKHQLTSKELFQ